MITRTTSYATSLQLQQTTQSLTSQLGLLTNEISSGVKASPSCALGSGAALIYQLQYQSDEQTALQTSTTRAGDRLDTVQTALTGIASVTSSVETSALGANVQTATGYAALASEAQGGTEQVLDLLNTRDAGQSVFGGDNSAGAAMNTADAANGPTATINGIVSQAVTAKGGTALTASDVPGLLSSVASVFNDTSTDASKNYSGSYFLAGNDGKPTQVVTGQSQAITYTTTADQPAFRDMLHGLALLGTLDSAGTTMDDTAKAQIVSAGTALLQKGQSELTTQQGVLGAKQAELQTAVDVQKSTATATIGQITSLDQADTYADATKLVALQTQLQASYEITAQLSKLSFVNYMPT